MLLTLTELLCKDFSGYSFYNICFVVYNFAQAFCVSDNLRPFANISLGQVLMYSLPIV